MAFRKLGSSGEGTILLVEDQPSLRELFQAMLKRNGYRVFAAATPTQTLEISGHVGKVDLLMTDVILPGMNGGILAERFMKVQPQIKVLFVSGFTENIVSQGKLDSEIGFLQKPFAHHE